jgi:hypothetical protein
LAAKRRLDAKHTCLYIAKHTCLYMALLNACSSLVRAQVIEIYRDIYLVRR